MSNARAIQQQRLLQTTVNSSVGVFVRMDERYAVVNLGTSTVTVPCIGFYPPTAGMSVRVDWVNGSPAVTGPVRPLNPLGTITATGTPLATVEVDGEPFTLPYRTGYTPGVDDIVEINWTTGIIQGAITQVNEPEPPPTGGGGGESFTVTVRAADSGRYQTAWWGNDPWASNNNDGAWFYGNRVRDAVGGGTVSSVDIYLPLIGEVGNASVGVHPHASKPGGGPALGTLSNLPAGRRSGWQRLPDSYGPYLAAGGRGVGVTAPGGGYTRWRGVASDSSSGSLRISGTR